VILVGNKADLARSRVITSEGRNQFHFNLSWFIHPSNMLNNFGQSFFMGDDCVAMINCKTFNFSLGPL
jgi:hypothetical protein